VDPRELLVRWRDDPLAFCEDVFPPEQQPTGFQREVLRLLAEKRSLATLAPRGSGKSHATGLGALWFHVTRPNTQTLIVSPQYSQTAGLWREIQALWVVSKLPRLFPKWQMLAEELRTELPTWIMRAVSAETGPARLTGAHGPEGVLLVGDEAREIEDRVWQALQPMLIGPESRRLAVSSAGLTSGFFYRALTSDRAFWDARLVVPVEDVPRIREAAEQARREWGEHDPTYRADYLNEFIPSGLGQPFFDAAAVERAIGKELAETEENEPLVSFGVDVSRFGRDLTVVAVNHGGVIKPLIVWRGLDTMTTCGKLMDLISTSNPHPHFVCVDGVGVGAGLVDRLREVLSYRAIDRFVNVVDVIAGAKPPRDTEHYANHKTFLASRLAGALERGAVSLPSRSPELISDLLSYQAAFASTGKQRIVDRADRSPDRGDAVLMSFAPEGAGPSALGLSRNKPLMQLLGY
jgi:hypothetical protein